MALSSTGRSALAILAIVIVAAVGIALRPGKDDRDAPDASPPTAADTPPPPVIASGAGGTNPPAKSTARPGTEPADGTMDEQVEALAKAGTAEDAREALDRLGTWLRSLPPGEAARVIGRFMADGQDVALPLDFQIGDGGFLESPPTLRVALLDMLGRHDPDAAAALGKEILSTPTSADEWAVALRNVARMDDDGSDRSYLLAKTKALIRNESWQSRPSVGYLNAFDVLVHTRATESTPLLSELIQRKDRRDLAHAGFLTLDRLTQRAPVEVLEQLADDDALRESRPTMVAQQFARADLRDDDQRSLVRSWLLDPARSQDELRAFAGVFPNNNRMISRNLLTTESPPSGLELRTHDRAVLALVTGWQQDPAFEKLRPQLDTMIGRLRQFTATPSPSGGTAEP